jgi:nitrilase
VPLLRHIATEGRCVVIGCCIAAKRSDIPDRYEFKKLYPKADKPEDVWINVGNSAIVVPWAVMAGPVLCEEKVIYAEINPVNLRQAKQTFDVAGHYARPDVFQLTINRDANEMINLAGAAPATNGQVSKSPAKPRRK